MEFQFTSWRWFQCRADRAKNRKGFYRRGGCGPCRIEYYLPARQPLPVQPVRCVILEQIIFLVNQPYRFHARHRKGEHASAVRSTAHLRQTPCRRVERVVQYPCKERLTVAGEGVMRKDQVRRKRGRFSSAFAGAFALVLAAMETVEPWAVGEGNYDQHRISLIVAYVSLAAVFGLMFWRLRPTEGV